MKPIILLLAIQCTATPLPAQTILQKYEATVFHYCAETGVPLYIAHNMITEESGWCTWAHNGVAGGLVQLSYRFHDEFRYRYNGGLEFSEFDPEANVRIGLRYLAHLHELFGTWRKALTYFNAGYSTGVIRSVRKLVDRELGGV
jgi:hypothetical protein